MEGLTIKYITSTMICIIGLLFFSGTAFAEKNYRIQPGDTLYSIARDHQVDVNTLIAANASINSLAHIFAGQSIKIPDADGSPFTVTAYTAGKESTGKEPGDPGYGVTASGTVVQEGTTMACPPNLPFGTEVHIAEMDETYVCEDRGSAITNGHLDIYMRDLDDALDFGVQDLQVQISVY